MLSQILNIDFAEISEPTMQRQEGKATIFDFQTLHQFAAKVETGSRCNNSPFLRGEDILITFHIVRLSRSVNVFRQRSFSQGIKRAFEIIMIPIIQET